MTDPDSPPVRGRRRTGAKGRLEAFSDGVFAIAITILVLELSVPAASEHRLLEAVLDRWPSYLAYLVSFTTIGIVWIKHSAITGALVGADSALMRLNLALLLLVSFLPFPTKLIAEYLDSPASAERVAVVLYGGVLLLISVLLSVLWRYALAAGLVDEGLPAGERDEMTGLLAPSMGFYAATIVLGLFAPKLAVLGMLAIALVLGIPGRAIGRALRHRG